MAAQHSTYIGARFGRLEVIGSPEHGANRRWYVNTRCDCGTVKAVLCKNLVAGFTISCGCYNRARDRSQQNRSHGMSGSGAFRSYHAMKTRCCNPRASNFGSYGGRGITICARWLESFENFLADMGERPDDATLDRIDTDGNYCPENCRWATDRQQRNNQRRTRRITFRGVTKSLAEWSADSGIQESTINVRLRLEWSMEDALTKPAERGRNQFGRGVPVTLDGRTKTWAEWAHEIGIPYSTLKKRIEYGWSLRRTLTAPLEVHRKKPNPA